MPREHKTQIRMNNAEYDYTLSYALVENLSVPEYIRRILHDHILSKEGEEAAIHLLRGHLPERTA